MELDIKSSCKRTIHSFTTCQVKMPAEYTFLQPTSPSLSVTQNLIKDYMKISVTIEQLVIFISSIPNRCQDAFETLVTHFKN